MHSVCPLNLNNDNFYTVYLSLFDVDYRIQYFDRHFATIFLRIHLYNLILLLNVIIILIRRFLNIPVWFRLFGSLTVFSPSLLNYFFYYHLSPQRRYVIIIIILLLWKYWKLPPFRRSIKRFRNVNKRSIFIFHFFFFHQGNLKMTSVTFSYRSVPLRDEYKLTSPVWFEISVIGSIAYYSKR